GRDRARGLVVLPHDPGTRNRNLLKRLVVGRLRSGGWKITRHGRERADAQRAPHCIPDQKVTVRHCLLERSTRPVATEILLEPDRGTVEISSLHRRVRKTRTVETWNGLGCE